MVTIYFNAAGVNYSFNIFSFNSANCSFGEFRCSNDKCIDSSKLCNGFNECGDMSDETAPCGIIIY